MTPETKAIVMELLRAQRGRTRELVDDWNDWKQRMGVVNLLGEVERAEQVARLATLEAAIAEVEAL